MESFIGEILIIDNLDANREFFSETLTEKGYTVRSEKNGCSTLSVIKQSSPDLILLNVVLPELDGFEVCRRLKADVTSRDIPVIFISEFDVTEDIVTAFAVGGVDFISKPFRPEVILARISTHLKFREVHNQLQDSNIKLREEIADRASNEEMLRRVQRVMMLLNDITWSAFSNQDYQEMLQTLADNLGDVFTADGSFITEWDNERELAIPLAASGAMRDIYPTFKLKPGDLTATGAAIQAGHPLAIENVRNSPFFNQRISDQFPSHSMLVLPLFRFEDGRNPEDRSPLGAVLISFKSPHRITDEEIASGEYAAEQIAQALSKAKLMIKINRRASEFHALYETTQAIAGEVELPILLHLIIEKAQDLLSATGGAIYLYEPAEQNLEAVVSTNKKIAMGSTIDLGEGITGRVAQTQQPLVVEDYSVWDGRAADFENNRFRSAAAAPMLFNGELIGVLVVFEYGDSNRKYTQEDANLLSVFVLQAAAAIHSARLFTEARDHLGELNRLSTVFRTENTVDEALPRFLDEALATLHARDGSIWLFGPDQKLKPAAARGLFAENMDIQIDRIVEDLTEYALLGYESFVSREVATDIRLPDGIRTILPHGFGGVFVPVRTAQEEMGILIIAVNVPRIVQPEEAHFLSTLAEMVGNSIHRMRLHQLTERRLNDIQALREIDRAISVSMDVRLSLGILLDQSITRLKIDAACVFLFQPSDNSLEHAACRGFYTRSAEDFNVKLGQGPAGLAALERRVIHVPDLRIEENSARKAVWIEREELVSAYAMPLIAKGELKGVLEVFHRELCDLDPEWVDVLGALATQAAIALDNADMFEGMQRSNLELLLAYETTIEGWAMALDMREHETGQHTQRVTNLTELLAREMEIGGEALTQIRRGALLHDIGKIGVPDSILLKPGKLTEEEWIIMRQHPENACQMLRPIDYLQPAIDIPYCHHEKWDGTGYPRGLKGEQIPLAARIFAVVDVWDALTNDRPYRDAWPEDKVIKYIQEQSGTHFDPRVVDVFVKLMRENLGEAVL